jgi:SAM-dependent methyltransferase
MKVLNLGCGATRPKDKGWINIDNLHELFTDPGCPERLHMDAEPNYLNHDLSQPLPFEENSIDGILASHLLEHFEMLDCLSLVEDCYRVLKPGGILRVSVPCPKKFHEGTLEGKTDWGEPVGEMRGKTTTMMNYALFFIGHKQILGIDAVFCMLYDAGFQDYEEKAFTHTWLPPLADYDNRPDFTIFIEGRK